MADGGFTRHPMSPFAAARMGLHGTGCLLPMTSLRFRCKVLRPPGLASSTNHDGEEIRETLNEALWATARRFVRETPYSGPSRSYGFECRLFSYRAATLFVLVSDIG
jgi:hypothetical protein